MIGRAAYDNPWMMSSVDREFFSQPDARAADGPIPTRGTVIEAMVAYLRRVQDAGVPAHKVLRHMLGLFAFQPGTRKYKQTLSGIRQDADGAELLRIATSRFDPEVLNS
jgi:tRNA-dihydrouridine synthase A